MEEIGKRDSADGSAAAPVRILSIEPRRSRCRLRCGDGHYFVERSADEEDGRLVARTLQDHDASYIFDALVYVGVRQQDGSFVHVFRFKSGTRCVCDTPNATNVRLQKVLSFSTDSASQGTQQLTGFYVYHYVENEGEFNRDDVAFLESADHAGRYLAFRLSAPGDVFLKRADSTPGAKSNTELLFSVDLFNEGDEDEVDAGDRSIRRGFQLERPSCRDVPSQVGVTLKRFMSADGLSDRFGGSMRGSGGPRIRRMVSSQYDRYNASWRTGNEPVSSEMQAALSIRAT